MRLSASLRATMACLLTGVLSSCAHHSISTSYMTVEDSYLSGNADRVFEIRYAAKVSEIPAGSKRLRLWWPVPGQTNLQEISGLKFGGAGGVKVAREPKYGNLIAYVEVENPPAAVEFEMTFAAKRREARVELSRLAEEGSDPAGSFGVFREPDRLVVVDEEVKEIAAAATGGKSTTVAKARGIYDAVMGRMTYDKSGTGWGRGDTKFACEAGKGNCTDFHALFNSLCRASGIASGFEIGLYLPYEAKKTESWESAPGGYHCWAAFRVPGKTWVPVDISEADRFPERTDFFFGGHTSNRVTLSTGRDLTLVPAQDGEPLNYFLDPYAEVDGKVQGKASKTWFFKDL